MGDNLHDRKISVKYIVKTMPGKVIQILAGRCLFH